MQLLHDIRRLPADRVLWYGRHQLCQSTKHEDRHNERGMGGFHEDCILDMYGVEDRRLMNIWYCECRICRATTNLEGMSHIFLRERNDPMLAFTYGPGPWEGRRETYICNDCKENVHFRDIFPNIEEHQHEYNLWGECNNDLCGHYDEDHDFDGVDPDHDFIENDLDGRDRCQTCRFSEDDHNGRLERYRRVNP